jgi:uncharacterized membrane protein
MPEPRTVEGVPSRAAIAGHPIHPMLVPFPVALLPAALVTDLVFVGTGDLFWARASLWLIVGGIATGALAAVFGLIDFSAVPRVREHKAGWIHAIGNVIAMALSVVNVLLRWDAPADAIMPLGLALSAVVGLILVVTGWYGGELSYRHGIGVVGPHRTRDRT